MTLTLVKKDLRVEIKSEKELLGTATATATEKKENEKESEPAVRIIMNADFFYTTIKYMQKLVKENPDAQKYVLEYNPNTKELFTDVTDVNEETNVS